LATLCDAQTGDIGNATNCFLDTTPAILRKNLAAGKTVFAEINDRRKQHYMELQPKLPASANRE